MGALFCGPEVGEVTGLPVVCWHREVALAELRSPYIFTNMTHTCAAGARGQTLIDTDPLTPE